MAPVSGRPTTHAVVNMRVPYGDTFCCTAKRVGRSYAQKTKNYLCRENYARNGGENKGLPSSPQAVLGKNKHRW